MRNNFRSLGKILVFSIAIICVYFFFLPFAPILIAGVITQGILGKVSGKVGPVVGGDWKGINYLRGYVIPANPQSTDQTTQRTRFTIMQDYVRQVLSTLVQPYWDQYQVGQSGYNAIMSEFLLNAPVSNLLTSAVKISKGTLSVQTIIASTYTAIIGSLSATWTMSLVGNQLASDTCKVLAFDKSTGILYFFDTATIRSAATVSVTLPTGLTATNIEVYVFFSQGSGSTMIVSDSDHITASAP